MRISLKHFGIILGTLTSALILSSATAAAQTWDANHVLDDYIANDYTSMTSSQIDSFLNSFPSSCISTNNGFAAPDLTGYSPSSGFTYGSNVSAGTVIAHASQAYGINPQVLLTTIQKEQSLVTGSAGCSTLAYAAAAGYGCPDGGTTYNYSGIDLYTLHGTTVTSVSGTCVNTAAKAGFSQQIVRAAWLLEFGEHRSEGDMNWDVQLTTTKDFSGNTWNSNWNNSDDPQSCYSGPMTQGTFQTCPSGPTVYYDGYTTIDSTSVHMDTGATAALYWYTPHFAGNQNFETIFNGWFGPTITSGFNWQYNGQNQFTAQTETTQADLNSVWPGQRYYLTVSAVNVGTQTWIPSIVHLGTSNPQDSSSPFYDSTWPSNNRAAVLDQSSVAPGQTGSFSFWVTIPNDPGIQRLYLNPVADGYSWMNDPGLYWQFNIQKPTYTWQWEGQNAFTDQTMSTVANLNNVTPGERYYLVVDAKNTGNEPWNPGTVNLGTDAPGDRSSNFYDGSWVSTNRATTVPSVVEPGQTVSIGFWVRAPLKLSQGGTYREHFNLVADGITWLNDPGLYWQFTVPNAQYSWQWQGQDSFTDQTMSTVANLNNVTPGQRYYLTATIKNTGNVVWYPNLLNLGTSEPTDNNSAFHDSTWLSSNRPSTIPATVQPGQTTTIGFWVTIPNQTGSQRLYLTPVADGITWLQNVGMYWQFNIQ